MDNSIDSDLLLQMLETGLSQEDISRMAEIVSKQKALKEMDRNSEVLNPRSKRYVEACRKIENYSWKESEETATNGLGRIFTRKEGDEFRNSGRNFLSISTEYTEIEEGALRNCPNLIQVSLGNRVRKIGRLAFANCQNLQYFYSGTSIDKIGDMAFACCPNLNWSRCLSEARLIGKEAFMGCLALENITSNSVYIGDGAFSLTGITEFQIGPRTQQLGYGILADNPQLRSIDVTLQNYFLSDLGCNMIAEKQTGRLMQGCVNSYLPRLRYAEIAPKAFLNMPINDVRIPESVSRIGSQAFYGSSMNLVVLPENLKTIGAEAFANCSKLEEIYYKGTQEEWDKVEKGENWDGGREIKFYTEG